MSRILITGASTGFGRASAIELAARGHDVVATAHDVATLTDLEVSDRLTLDVTDQASVDAATAAAGAVTCSSTTPASPPRPDRVLPDGHRPARLRHEHLRGAPHDAGTGPGHARPRPRHHRERVVRRGLRDLTDGRHLLGLQAHARGVERSSQARDGSLRHPRGDRQPGYFATPIQHKANPVPIDDTPYAGLQAQWQGADERLLGGQRPGPEVVARAIADAIEMDDCPLRIPVGADAEMVARCDAPPTTPSSKPRCGRPSGSPGDPGDLRWRQPAAVRALAVSGLSPGFGGTPRSPPPRPATPPASRRPGVVRRVSGDRPPLHDARSGRSCRCAPAQRSPRPTPSAAVRSWSIRSGSMPCFWSKRWCAPPDGRPGRPGSRCSCWLRGRARLELGLDLDLCAGLVEAIAPVDVLHP